MPAVATFARGLEVKMLFEPDVGGLFLSDTGAHLPSDHVA